jgi:hypothetical protein
LRKSSSEPPGICPAHFKKIFKKSGFFQKKFSNDRDQIFHLDRALKNSNAIFFNNTLLTEKNLKKNGVYHPVKGQYHFP